MAVGSLQLTGFSLHALLGTKKNISAARRSLKAVRSHIDILSRLMHPTPPMPLKHNTETAMMFVLGLMTALVGVAAAFLPPVTVSILPWAVAFAVMFMYPLMLYPMMRENRADHTFRVLHFMPAAILFVWLAVDLIAAFFPALQPLQRIFTYGWSAIAVLIGFVLLFIFIFRVLRQKFKRIALLLCVLLPFLLLAHVSEQQSWDRKIANVLWDRSGSGAIIAGTSSGNLSPSTDPFEEQWRAELRAMERRRQALLRGEVLSLESSSATQQSSIMEERSSNSSIMVIGAITGVIGTTLETAGSSSSVSSESPVSSEDSSSSSEEGQSSDSFSSFTSSVSSSRSSSSASSKKIIIAQQSSQNSSTTPPKLPTSGPMEMAGVLALLMGASYTAVVHRTTVLRSRSR